MTWTLVIQVAGLIIVACLFWPIVREELAGRGILRFHEDGDER